MSDSRWNLNIHYHSVILEVVSPLATTALDVGCGDGLLSFDLAKLGLDVLGVDPDSLSIQRARKDPAATHKTAFLEADLFDQFTSDTFDVVASSAMLHHVDADAGLRRMKELLSPGGTLVAVGFAQPSSLRDFVLAAVGRVFKALGSIRRDHWEHNAPICWPPPLTMKEMKALTEAELPGSSLKSLMSGRYLLVWRSPELAV